MRTANPFRLSAQEYVHFFDGIAASGQAATIAPHVWVVISDEFARLKDQCGERVGHARSCPVSQPGFVASLDAKDSQCNCDFGVRLHEAMFGNKDYLSQNEIITYIDQKMDKPGWCARLACALGWRPTT